MESDDGRTGSAAAGRIVREMPVAGRPAATRVPGLTVPVARSAAGHPGSTAPAPERPAPERPAGEQAAAEQPAGGQAVGGQAVPTEAASEHVVSERAAAEHVLGGLAALTDGRAPNAGADGRAPGADLEDGMDGADEEPGGEVRSRDFVQSFARGLMVILAFTDGTEMSLSDVARATRLPRAAARRFLLTLEELGYMQCTGRLFSPSPALLGLALPYLASGAGQEELLGAINGSIPFARASRSSVHHGLLPKLAAAARPGSSSDSAG